VVSARRPRHIRIMDEPKRIRRVTVKTERTFIFRSQGSHRVEWCAECGAEVGMACVDAAAREAGVSELAIYKRVWADDIRGEPPARG
jgi:hypothetical protein